MSAANQDTSQWLSVTEETLFMHDGVMRVSDIVELPVNVGSNTDSDEQEMISFDSKSPQELSERLLAVCGTQNNAYTRLLEYRLSAVKGLWKAQIQVVQEEEAERSNAQSHPDDTITLLKKQGVWKEPEPASFSTRMSLLLVLPLIQSQSKLDPSLGGITGEVLLNSLKDCAPLSLNKEPSDCLNGIEDLLCSWLCGEDSCKVKDDRQRKNTASALVALATARGNLKTFIHAVHLLQNMEDLPFLPVRDILEKLLEMEGGQGQQSSLMGSKHIVCWGFEDMLNGQEKEEKSNSNDKGVEIGRSVACDGQFLFITAKIGAGLVKVGTGLHGTLRGYVYARNSQLCPGYVAYGNHLLVHRPVECDREENATRFVQILNLDSLEVVKVVPRPESYPVGGPPYTSVGLCSDGVTFYWLTCQGTPADKNTKGQLVTMEKFKIDKSDLQAIPLQPGVVLQKKDEPSSKSLNDALLSRLRPYRSSATAATLVALTGGESPMSKKEEVSSSCGISLKNLIKTPIYCDGTTVVMLSPLPGGGAGGGAGGSRFSFGSTGGGLASIRALGSNLCFNVSDGNFIMRTDLVDAPTCGLGRGAAIQGMGMCYDPVNHYIWTVSQDWVDQYYSPAHQSTHHVLTRLGICKDPCSSIKGETTLDLPRTKVIEYLLVHIGSMCLHQLNNDLLYTPLGSYFLQQHSVHLTYMGRVCDILSRAVETGDEFIMVATLIVLQLMFKTSVFKREDPKEQEQITRVSELMWRILEKYNVLTPDSTGQVSSLAQCVRRKVCAAMMPALEVIYPTDQQQSDLLSKLLNEAESDSGLAELRDMILLHYADKLKEQVIDAHKVRQARLTSELTQYIIKMAVKDSCTLLRKCQSLDRAAMETLLSTIPRASPGLQYLHALQTHIVRTAICYKTPNPDSEKDQLKNTTAESLTELQGALLVYATKVFAGTNEVLEVLLETCISIINSKSQAEDLDYWLLGVEKVAKATMLGHLVPLLVTAMTHHNLRCLSIADTIMSELVQLIVLTSQAALLLKSQVQSVGCGGEEQVDLSPDVDITTLIGTSLGRIDSSDIQDKEENGFLSGLKIPTPWTTGKTLESIHPVRDNYKFKETVHIPGARCLFLRFDPRSSSQYDYDKLVVYAGPNTNSKKVSEYGGNTLGFGSRSVLGSGWPKDLVKVEGDSVTFSFEMRSGREHNTPDKAMWGFMVTVRAQENSDEVTNGLPFAADLALGLSVLGCTMLHLLYQGPETSAEEVKCQHLLKSRLLQRCVWQSEDTSSLMSSIPWFSEQETPPPSPKPQPKAGDHSTEQEVDPSPQQDSISEGLVPQGGKEGAGLQSSPVHRSLPRVRMPSEVVKKLREMSEKQVLHMRPSIRDVIRPNVLEESIISATLKHLSLVDTVRHLVSHEEHNTEEYRLLRDVMSEVYRKIHALIRQLQTIAELEQRWNNEVEDVKQGVLTNNEVFFIDYHLVENKAKELAILCFFKDIPIDVADLETAVSELSERLDTEVSLEGTTDAWKCLPRTRGVVNGILERVNLLLHVTIMPEGGVGPCSRTMSLYHHRTAISSAMVRSDTDVLKGPSYSRSMSLPGDHITVDDTVLEVMRLQKRRHKKGPASILQDLVEEDLADRPPQIILVDHLFAFIGSSPEKAVSCESFLSAAKTRWKRGKTRQQALVHMKELLTAATKVGGTTHLVAAVTSVLQHGPRIEELTCGGVANYVREAFAETMTSVVQLAAFYPIACCNSIGLLCIIPYTRSDEKCLVRSGLVHLLDKLCSLTNYRSENATGGPTSTSETHSAKHRVSMMAWAGFQVLSNRCVSWEQEDGGATDQLEHSGLACQVSTLLTNHLARATECIGNEAAGNEALQEVLSLLNGLSKSRMGKAILSQPGCVSRLLSLLLDQRPSPKLVLIILQLCRVALPLMSSDDCEKIDLPAWGQEIHETIEGTERGSKPERIASLLLAKLGDYLTPGGHTTVSSRRPSLTGLDKTGMSPSTSDKDKNEDKDIQDGRLSVFINKREEQSSHEVIQPLLSADNRPFRLSGGSGNMEKVVRMDKAMTRHGKAEIVTEDAVSALRKAAKWAQMGLVVSTEPPVDTATPDTSASDKKKSVADVVCKDKNLELARTDPVRPFISGHVANSMATEVIGLLHSLLTITEVRTAQTWALAVEQVISSALSSLPILLTTVEEMTSPRCNKEQLMTMAKQANAALAASGGFEETVKPGSIVQITGEGSDESEGLVRSVSEATGLATIELLPPSSEDFTPPRYSDTVQVPICRLRPHNQDPLPLHQLSMTESIVSAVQGLLLPQSGSGSPLAQHLPIFDSDAQAISNQICRVLAEVRSRACKVLALHLKDLGFASAFIQHSSASIDILKQLAKECREGERLGWVEGLCQRMRMLYRDCAQPPPPPAKLPQRMTNEITWNSRRSFPPIRSCLFSHGYTGVTFLGDPSAGSGLPRGTIIYASQPVPAQAPSFYWEVEILSFGDPQEESSPFISFGFMPAAEKKDGGWSQPVGSCLFHNNGRAVHYNGASLLQWRSIRLDVNLGIGDTVGVGWERQPDSPIMQGETCKGKVFFTYNGRRLQPVMEDVNGSMWPMVHLQKKNTRIRANFGGRQFMYAEGQEHRIAADDFHDLIQEIRDNFGVLPFALVSDSESDSGSMHSASSEPSPDIRTPPGPPSRTPTIPKSLKEYNTENCVTYKLKPCYENFLSTGPDIRTQQANQDNESDLEETEEEDHHDDHYVLLVKAWEQKVFPVIRRRFRNEAERKDGLEQIKGALQLGMVDIARQTVEFLYEENGGMPRDLHLPTIDDIREELAKFTIERVRKGTMVVVRQSQSSGLAAGTTLLPKFAVRGMVKTFGLTGIVLDVDQPNQLVQVETYLRSEGVLVRFWYPLEVLERPPQGYRKSSLVGQQLQDTSSIHIHRELLKQECHLAKMYCRSALLELITQCNSPALELTSCASGLGAAMAASAALLQELDVENLQLLSNELLTSAQPHGSVSGQSLLTTSSLGRCLGPHSCSPLQLFYEDGSHTLREELKVAIARAANQGEDYVIELSNQICMCLQTAPEMFPYEEFPVSESKICTDVHFPDAAFLLVSCRTDPKAVKKDTSLYKSPWARIFTYHGHRVKKTGHSTKQEVVSYPRDTTNITNPNELYSPVIIPTDTLHVRVGVAPPPGVILTIHALPPQFPLSLTYIETLVMEGENFEYRRCDSDLGKPAADHLASSSTAGGASLIGRGMSQSDSKSDSGATSPWRTFDSIVITPAVLMHVFDLLCGYMWRTDLPALMKEYLFHLMAQTLRMLRVSEAGMSDLIPTCSPQYSPTMSLLKQLQAELKRLYDEETKHWPTGTTVSGPGIGLGIGDTGRFSTYFHALMEICLAIAEVTPLHPISGSLYSGAEEEDDDGGKESELETGLTLVLPSSPLLQGKRKKLKAKRVRAAAALPTHPSRRSGSPRRPSESEGSPLSSSPVLSGSESAGGLIGASPSSSGTSVSTTSSRSNVSIQGSRPEEMLWYHRAVTMSQIMRYVTSGDSQGHVVTNDAIADAFQCLSVPTSFTRLLVITGIPKTLNADVVKSAIRKSCRGGGGLFKEELYLPVASTAQSEIKSKSDTNIAKDTNTTTAVTSSSNNSSSSRAGSKSTTQAKSESQIRKGMNPGLRGEMIQGYCVVEIRTKAKMDQAKKSLYKNKTFLEELSLSPEQLSDDILTVSTVTHQLLTEPPQGNEAVESYLRAKLLVIDLRAKPQQQQLGDGAMIALTDIFHSCFISEQRHSTVESPRHQESGFICLGKEQIVMQSPGNMMQLFFGAIKPAKKMLGEQVKDVLRHYGVPKVMDKDDSDKKSKPTKKPVRPSSKEKLAMATSSSQSKQISPKDKKPLRKDSKEALGKQASSASGQKSTVGVKLHKELREEDKLLTLDGFLQYVTEKLKQDVRLVWKALFACGFDLHFERCGCMDTSQAQQMNDQWTPDMDGALTHLVNKLCQDLALSPARIHPHEIYLTESELTSDHYTSLQGIPVESLRLRFALLQSLNSTLESFFLPLVDLRPALGPTLTKSSAALLARARTMMFFDTKMVLLDRIINATVQRKPDQAAPEITLDPLQNVGGEKRAPMNTNFCQALRQLASVSSSQLCVRLAAGGDPTYSFNVRFTGEEVHGTSGSFRHFLCQVVRELESSVLDLFILCPSSAGQKNKGKYILRPGNMSFPEEKLLHFLGQLIAIAIRADIPFGLDLLPLFWKNLVGLRLDPVTDLQEADVVTYNYIKKFEMLESEDELRHLYADMVPRFVYSSLNGEEVEVIPNGRNICVNWENKQLYADNIRHLRMCELSCAHRVLCIKAGLATILPIQLLSIMSPEDLSLRSCGLPEVNLDFLKAHTMYQVGLMESDPHIQYFWNVLEDFTQEELCRFIRFSCNQERIPQSCPCRDGGPETAHVPPYPMKIAPPDGQGNADSRYIRVETCMFMIKLPQYSSEELMKQRLLYAIHCREDPLSG